MVTSSRPRTELRRVTVCEHDERLEVKSVRGIGFAWRCSCGARGKVWRTRAGALWGMREHEDTHR